MCGLAGTSNISHPITRYKLISALGEGIDERGGHSAGYVNYTGRELNIGRKLGYWSNAQRSFIRRASQCKLSMMHARYATCGKGDIKESHPFAIKRRGKIVLYGAHNGIIFNAKESSKKNNREIVVDSEEIFNLIADNDWDGVNNLKGYGVITWIYTGEPESIYLLRLTNRGEIHIVRTQDDSIVYGSTKEIVDYAISSTTLKEKYFFNVEVGKVYAIREGNFWQTDETFPTVNIKEQLFSKKPVYHHYPRVKTSGNDFIYYDNNNTNYTNNYTNSDFLSGSSDSLDNWINAWKRAQEKFDNKAQGAFEKIDNNTLTVDKDDEFLHDREDDDFNLYCENCDKIIDYEEESEIEMLQEEFMSEELKENMICMKCLGF